MSARARTVVATVIVALGLVAAACGPGFSEADPTSAIFEGAPWDAEERLSYEFKQRTNLYGLCELRTTVDAAAGTTELAQLCVDADEGLYQDDRIVIVESDTLKPINSERALSNANDDELETKRATYADDGSAATFISVSGENEFSATRDLPQPSVDVPEPVWYDDNTLMWLVRGIDFSETEAIDFTDVNPTTVTVFNVELLIEGREQVDVPAGVFEAWKIRLKTRTVTHRVWVEVDAPHRVVKAQIENGTYELVEAE